MGGTGLFGGPIRADGSEDRGDGCSDIVTQDDGDGRVEGQEALYAEGDGQADRSGAGLDKEGKQRSGQNPHERVVAEHGGIIPFHSGGTHGGFHGLHSHEKQTKTQ